MQRKENHLINIICVSIRTQTKPFVLDCLAKGETKLPLYDGIKDMNLKGFFAKPSIRKHIKKYYIVS